MIYLDYSANTPVDPAVLEVFLHTETTYHGNPNSSHPAGLAAREKLKETTESIADLLHIQPSEVIYTSGASEANNLAIKGIARTQRNYGRHIISTALEHPSVSGPLTWLQEQGYEIDLADIRRDEIPFSFSGVDTASMAAHKFYGLNGSGMLFKRNSLVLDPLIHGGSGASLYRSGTPTLGLATALESALRLSVEQLPERYERAAVLNQKLRDALSRYACVRINSPKEAVPHILNLSVSGVKGIKMQQILSEHGVCVSVKSACSTEGTPSKAVFAVSRDRKNALSSWRISLSHKTTDDEIREFLEIFGQCIKELA